MSKERLYVLHGMGSDAVGLVGRITAAIAKVDGNIVDLRQDVLHGLFTIYLVVDLAESELDFPGLQTMLNKIAHDTKLKLSVEEYSPIARSPDKMNLLMILIGKDKPGIIASSCEMLGKYNANIEFAQTIGREGVFLMELLMDVSHTSIPVDNLRQTISRQMEALKIKTTFQDENVFNKRKRIIVFHIEGSLISRSTIDEIIQQTELSLQDLAGPQIGTSPADASHPESMKHALTKLDGLPFDALDAVLEGVTPTADNMELIQTLKVMGYKIILVSRALSYFTDSIRKKMDLDYAFGIPHEVDDDARTIGAELTAGQLGSDNIDRILSQLTRLEQVDRNDITIITDEDCLTPPGIRLNVNLEILLDCFNQHVVSKDNLIGLLGSFGALHLG